MREIKIGVGLINLAIIIVLAYLGEVIALMTLLLGLFLGAFTMALKAYTEDNK